MDKRHIREIVLEKRKEAGASSVVIHGFPVSPPTQTALLAALEAGVNVDLANVVVFEGKQYSPEHLAVNPFGKVPVLIDSNFDGLKVLESRAIAKYFAANYAEENTLLPSSPVLVSKMEEILSIESSYISPHFYAIFLNLAIFQVGLIPAYDEALINTHMTNKDLIQSLKWLEQTITEIGAGGPYLLGTQFTLADVALVSYTNWLQIVKEYQPALFTAHPIASFCQDEANFPNLTKWWNAVKERSCVQTVWDKSKECMDIAMANKTKDVPPTPHPSTVEYRVEVVAAVAAAAAAVVVEATTTA